MKKKYSVYIIILVGLFFNIISGNQLYSQNSDKKEVKNIIRVSSSIFNNLENRKNIQFYTDRKLILEAISTDIQSKNNTEITITKTIYKSEIELPKNTPGVLDHIETGWRATYWIDFGDNVILPYYFYSNKELSVQVGNDSEVLINNINYQILNKNKSTNGAGTYSYLLMDDIKERTRIIENEKKVVKGKQVR